MHHRSFSGHTNGIQIGNDNIHSDRKGNALLNSTHHATLTDKLLKNSKMFVVLKVSEIWCTNAKSLLSTFHLQ